MAHTNQTPNYNLSEFVGTDKPAWLVDYNGDMEKIDLGLKDAKDVADAAKAEADQGAHDIAAVTVTANAADAKASEALSNIADVYDATNTYALGNLVLYEGILYKANVDITVPEPFTGSHWNRVTIEDLYVLLENNITAANTAILNNRIRSVVLGGTVLCNVASANTIGYRTDGAHAVRVDSLTGYPSDKRVFGYTCEYAYGNNASEAAIVNIYNSYIYANSKVSGTITFGIRVYYSEI